MEISVKNLIQKVGKGESKGLINNFISLCFLQGTNFILPLLVLPYLIRTLGIEKFGLVSFSQVLALYLVILAEYGFNLSATKDVSINRDNPEKLREIFSTVTTTRLLLCLIGFAILLLLIIAIEPLRNQWKIHILSSTMMFGQAIVPVWFFLGMEKMKFITYLNIISKSIFTLLTFLIILTPEDYIYANLLHGLGSICAGIISTIIIWRYFGIKFKFSSLNSVKEQLKISFPIFISNFATNIYLNINIVILNAVSTAEVVGMYSIAEKVFIAAKQLISVVFQTVYPHGCKIAQDSEFKFKLFYTRIAFISSILFLGMGIFTFLFADQIINLLAGKDLPYAATILRLMSFIPFIISHCIPAHQATLIFDYKKIFSIIMIFASIGNIALNFVLGYYFSAFGTVWAIIITELFVMLSLNYVIWNKRKIAFLDYSRLITR